MGRLFSSPFFAAESNEVMRGISSSHGVYAPAVWPAADRAIAAPIWFRQSFTLDTMRVAFTASAGNYDLALYDDTFRLLASKGSTAVSLGVHSLTVNQRLAAGRVYYAAMVCSSTTAATFRSALSAIGLVSFGSAQQASALPLPNPFVPALPASAYTPLFAFTGR